MSEREKRRDTTLGVCWESCSGKMLWESKSPPEYNAGLLIQPTDTGSPPLRETMEAQQQTGVRKHRGLWRHKGIEGKAKRGEIKRERKNATCRRFPSWLLLLISVKGCWMSAEESDHSPRVSSFLNITSKKIRLRGKSASMGVNDNMWKHLICWKMVALRDFEEGRLAAQERCG